MECFLFPFHVGDLLIILLLRIVSELPVITPRTGEAEKLLLQAKVVSPSQTPSPALLCSSWSSALNGDEREQLCSSVHYQHRRAVYI